MSETLHGKPILSDWAWCVVRLDHSGTHWFVLEFTVARTRRAAIRLLDQTGGPGTYERGRRRGELRALRCEVQPCTFEPS